MSAGEYPRNMEEKRMGEKVVSLWNHLLITLSLTFLTFLVLHYYNARMGFLTNGISRGMLGVYCLMTAVNSVCFLVRKTGQERKRRKKEKRGGEE